MNKVLICTVVFDWPVSQHIQMQHWVAFGTGNLFCYYCITTITINLEQVKSCCLPPFQAFTGCDTTSSFFW